MKFWPHTKEIKLNKLHETNMTIENINEYTFTQYLSINVYC